MAEDEIFLPEVRRYNGVVIQKRDWRGRRKGERLKYRWKTTPYRHQVDAVKKLLSTGFGGALLMEPRTGKTKTLIDYASILYKAEKIDRMVVFCPLSVLGVWEHEFATHCPVPYRITVWDSKSRREKSLPRWGSPRLEVVVLNYDALSSPGRVYITRKGYEARSRTRGGRYDVYRALEHWQPQLVVLDESHIIKTATAKKTGMILKLAKVADYRVIMTGTVVTKKKRMHDVWAQWEFLNPSRFDMTHAEFKAFYGRFLNRGSYDLWIQNNNTDLLRMQIHQDSYAISREECFDLPPRLPNEIHHINLTDSGTAYDDMAEYMLHQIETGEVTEASLAIVQTLRLRQITGGVARTAPTLEFPDGRLYRVGQEKLDHLEDVLADLCGQEEKVVVAAQFVNDILSIQHICDRLKIKSYLLYGAIKRSDRDKNIADFRKHEGPAVFIMNPQAGSLGIDLSTAGVFIWFSLTNSYVHYTQAEDRIALNQRGTKYIYLLATGTVDEVVYEVLQGDGDVAKAIMTSPRRLLREVD